MQAHLNDAAVVNIVRQLAAGVRAAPACASAVHAWAEPHSQRCLASQAQKQRTSDDGLNHEATGTTGTRGVGSATPSPSTSDGTASSQAVADPKPQPTLPGVRPFLVYQAAGPPASSVGPAHVRRRGRVHVPGELVKAAGPRTVLDNVSEQATMAAQAAMQRVPPHLRPWLRVGSLSSSNHTPGVARPPGSRIPGIVLHPPPTVEAPCHTQPSGSGVSAPIGHAVQANRPPNDEKVPTQQSTGPHGEGQDSLAETLEPGVELRPTLTPPVETTQASLSARSGPPTPHTPPTSELSPATADVCSTAAQTAHNSGRAGGRRGPTTRRVADIPRATVPGATRPPDLLQRAVEGVSLSLARVSPPRQPAQQPSVLAAARSRLAAVQSAITQYVQGWVAWGRAGLRPRPQTPVAPPAQDASPVAPQAQVDGQTLAPYVPPAAQPRASGGRLQTAAPVRTDMPVLDLGVGPTPARAVVFGEGQGQAAGDAAAHLRVTAAARTVVISSADNAAWEAAQPAPTRPPLSPEEQARRRALAMRWVQVVAGDVANLDSFAQRLKREAVTPRAVQWSPEKLASLDKDLRALVVVVSGKRTAGKPVSASAVSEERAPVRPAVQHLWASDNVVVPAPTPATSAPDLPTAVVSGAGAVQQPDVAAPPRHSSVDQLGAARASPAEARRQELLHILEALSAEAAALQDSLHAEVPRLTQRFTSSGHSTSAGGQADGGGLPSLDFSLATPVWRASKRLRDVVREQAQLQSELEHIEAGTWKPRQATRVAAPPAGTDTGSASTPSSQELTEALDDLLSLMSGPTPTARPAARPVSVPLSRPPSAPRSFGPRNFAPLPQQLPQAPQPAEAPEVAAWVDDLRDLLGDTTPVASPAAHHAAVSVGAQQSDDDLSVAEQEVTAPPAHEHMAPLEIPAGVSVRQLAGLLGISPISLERWLVDTLGEVPASLEDSVSGEAAELAALNWGRTPVMTAWHADGGLPALPRPPVVTIMGHVDHGKTSLLDALRNTAVAASEAGGITQHVGAFQVSLPGAATPITFLDTPGHAAFSAMRARGAAVTDIIVLVVAADDGVMPQTREALSHARAAGCPIVVALTKCDLPSARPAAVRAALVAEGVELEDVGGPVQVVSTSARTAVGLDDLQEALLLQAELMELTAPHEGPAAAVVVEATQGRSGPQATVVVQRGKLRVGDTCVVGTQYGKVRALRSSTGQPISTDGVGPGEHAVVQGLRGLPTPGDTLQVVASEDRARRISAARASRAEDYARAQVAAALSAQRAREAAAVASRAAARRAVREARMSALSHRKQQTAAALEAAAAQQRSAVDAAPATPLTAADPAVGAAVADEAGEGPTVELRLVLKGDVQGSVEALRTVTQELCGPHVTIKVLHAGVGPVTPNDLHLATAAGGHVVAFGLGPQGGLSGPAAESALEGARQQGVTIFSHSIIYHLQDELRALVQGSQPFIEVEEEIGRAELVASFPLSAASTRKAREALPPGGGRIGGVRVLQGSVQRANTTVRVLRNGQVVHQGAVTSLRRHKLDVDQVGSGSECGVVVDEGRWSDWQPGDEVVCIQRVRRRAGEASSGTMSSQESGIRPVLAKTLRGVDGNSPTTGRRAAARG